MSTIRLLPEVLINQIAAGEVILRPCAAVKELVENSLDAGARQVEVMLTDGGVGRICVRDDGRGIPEGELILALKRHATSKLRTLEDLQRLSTLGFRGEALASLAAVSRLSLVSRTPESALAGVLQCVQGVWGVSPASHPPGTTVEALELFYNVPARRKFLKSPRAELVHTLEWLRALALSRPDVGFVLKHQDKTRLTLPAEPDGLLGWSGRVRRIFGLGPSNSPLYAQAKLFGKRVRLWVALEVKTPIRILLVNGRVVRDPLLQQAVRFAGSRALWPGEGPQAVRERFRDLSYALALELPPDRVDVNVHPTKEEVRFLEPRRVHEAVFHAFQGLEVRRDLFPMPLEPEAESDRATALDQPFEMKSDPISSSKRGGGSIAQAGEPSDPWAKRLIEFASAVDLGLGEELGGSANGPLPPRQLSLEEEGVSSKGAAQFDAAEEQGSCPQEAGLRGEPGCRAQSESGTLLRGDSAREGPTWGEELGQLVRAFRKRIWVFSKGDWLQALEFSQLQRLIGVSRFMQLGWASQRLVKPVLIRRRVEGSAGAAFAPQWQALARQRGFYWQAFEADLFVTQVPAAFTDVDWSAALGSGLGRLDLASWSRASSTSEVEDAWVFSSWLRPFFRIPEKEEDGRVWWAVQAKQVCPRDLLPRVEEEMQRFSLSDWMDRLEKWSPFQFQEE